MYGRVHIYNGDEKQGVVGKCTVRSIVYISIRWCVHYEYEQRSTKECVAKRVAYFKKRIASEISLLLVCLPLEMFSKALDIRSTSSVFCQSIQSNSYSAHRDTRNRLGRDGVERHWPALRFSPVPLKQIAPVSPSELKSMTQLLIIIIIIIVEPEVELTLCFLNGKWCIGIISVGLKCQVTATQRAKISHCRLSSAV